MGGVDEIGRQLRKTVAAVEKRCSGAAFDEHVTNPLTFVEEHQTVLVCDAGDVATKFVRGVRDGINPIALAEIVGINAAIADLAKASERQGCSERCNEDLFAK